MMSFVFKLLLTLDSLSMSAFIYLVNKKISIKALCPGLSYVIYFSLIVIFTAIILWLVRLLGTDTIESGSILMIEPANDAFLPSYLGYFFVALSVPNFVVFIIVFSVIGIFIFSSRISYFNPIFFLFGYHFYYVQTNEFNKILIISRRILKNPKTLSFENLKRINDFTFIEIGGNKK